MRNIIAQRAGAVLDRCYPGPHRDKLIARDFGLSVRMAQHLRAGEHWTLDRLSQASALLGAAFDAALYSPATDAQRHYELDEIAAIAERLARLERRVGKMDRRGDEGLAPEPGSEAVAQSRAAGAPSGLGARGGSAGGNGEASPGEGAPMARPLQRREVKP